MFRQAGHRPPGLEREGRPHEKKRPAARGSRASGRVPFVPAPSAGSLHRPVQL